MVRKYLFALLACGLAHGSESVEKFPVGAFTGGAGECGKLIARAEADGTGIKLSINTILG